MSFELTDEALESLRKLGKVPELDAWRYRLLGPLDQGGMGTVWLAEDLELRRMVAIKVMNAWEDSPEIAGRMLQEARIIAQLEHPGIIPVHAVGTLPDGRIYYVMKRVQGTRVDVAVGEGRTLVWRLGLFQRVCETIAFAHASGIVHRDIKPQNVMVGEFGEVLVLDWGLAKRCPEPQPDAEASRPEPPAGPAHDDEDSTRPGDAPSPSSSTTRPVPRDAVHTRDGTLLGTPAFMAPELRRGQNTRAGIQTDVYALGAFLYFLLTGQPPQFEADTTTPRPPRRLEPRIPSPLESICMHAMAPRPGDRYPGALEIASEVQRYLAGERVQAHPEGGFERTKRIVVRYRTPILVVVAYLLVRLVLLWASRP